jgi:RNA polymerase sigma-70 factor (ECF subfamily)
VTSGDDGDLIQAIADRDSSALMTLYDRYGRLSFALAYRIVGDPSLAEEVVQDAFLQVWNRATTFDHSRGGNVRGWLMTIVHHRSIDFRRRDLDRKPTHVPLEDVDHVLSVPDVWGAVSASLTRDHMRAAVDTLPHDQRRAIELAFFDGLTHGEIAERENAPLGTIKGRLRLGMRKLRAVLTDADDPHGLLLSGPDDDARQAESLSR